MVYTEHAEMAAVSHSKAKHGIFLGPTEIELFVLLFADDLTLLASTVIGLQNQLNALSVAAKRLGLTVWINQRSWTLERAVIWLLKKDGSGMIKS